MKAPERTLPYITGIIMLALSAPLLVNASPCGVVCAVGGLVMLALAPKNKKVERAPDSVTPPPTPSPPVEDPPDIKSETFHAVGMTYRLDNFYQLRVPNDEYHLSNRELKDYEPEYERIYEYDYECGTITLEDEPTNPYDPKAIKVIVDGHHVAYIKKGSTSRVRNLLKKNVVSITGTAGGGKYKIIIDDQIEKDEAPYWLHITIKYRET